MIWCGLAAFSYAASVSSFKNNESAFAFSHSLNIDFSINLLSILSQNGLLSSILAKATLADGYGARASGDGLSYACWIFFLNILPLHCYVLGRYGKDYLHYLRKRAVVGIGGGLAGLGSYGIAIWAMTVAPIALAYPLLEKFCIVRKILSAAYSDIISPEVTISTSRA